MEYRKSQNKHEGSSIREGLPAHAKTLPASFIALIAIAVLAIGLASCGDPTPEPTAAPLSTTPAAGRVSQTPVPPTATPTIADRDILVALYNSANGPNWQFNTNWLSDEPLGEWQGVTTDDTGRVTELVRQGGLTGDIPAELSNLSKLEVLYLGWNELSGGIPPELGRLANLQELNLSGNDLSGEIPLELSQLFDLRELDLSGNALSGKIPPELANLANLTKLSLGSNGLTGPFPPDLVKLQNLTYLDLGKTQVAGCLPDGWEGRFVLRFVDYDIVEDGSDLGGLPFCLHTSVPDLPEARDALTALYKATDGPNWKNNLNWLTAHPIGIWHGVTIGEGGRVVELRLPHNDLSGEIPLELSNLTDLFVLDLHRNNLIGEIPPELGKLTNLLHLDLSVNRLSGKIPPELGLLIRLSELNLHVNDLSGEIPPDLGNLRRLDTLSLWNNRLSGEIPPELTNLGRLETLDLGGNRLSGEVPPELGGILSQWLERLVVGGKRLNGVCAPQPARPA